MLIPSQSINIKVRNYSAFQTEGKCGLCTIFRLPKKAQLPNSKLKVKSLYVVGRTYSYQILSKN